MKYTTLIDYPLTQIKFDKNNPNTTTEKEEQASKAFLKRYGILRTVVIDAKGLCIDGEHIAKRAIERGDKGINVIQIEAKNPGEIAEIRTFLNYGPRGKPNEEKFADELEMPKFSAEYGPDEYASLHCEIARVQLADEYVEFR